MKPNQDEPAPLTSKTAQAAQALLRVIRLYRATGKFSANGIRPEQMSRAASRFTGKPYAASAAGYSAAIADLETLLGEKHFATE